jgi:hypothetical protein
VTRRRSRTGGEIPLWLLPQAVAWKVREWGDAVYRISVKRTHWHHYNVTVRTRPVRKELAPWEVATISPDAGRVTGKRSRAGRWRCTE